jgi:hypothetical protein
MEISSSSGEGAAIGKITSIHRKRLFIIKIKTMKALIIVALATVSLAACNNSTTQTTETTNDTATTTVSKPDTSSLVSTPNISATYTPGEGDVSYRNRKVVVMRNGQWVDAETDVTLDSGVLVSRSGKVKREGKEVTLGDSEVVTKSGNFFDRTGNVLSKAWDATKEGVKDAGQAVGKAARKVGEKARDAVTDDDKK